MLHIQACRLSSAEIKKLLRRHRRGDQEATQILFNSVSAWLVTEANRWARHIHEQLTEEDLFQVGFLGFLRALQDWDPARAKLLTYAVPWMRQAIRREVAWSARMIRLPMHVQDRTISTCRLCSQLSREDADDFAEKLSTAKEAVVQEAHILERTAYAHQLLRAVPQRRREILLQSCAGDTREAIAKRHDLSVVRVGQLIRDALRMVRNVRDRKAST